MNWRTRLKTGRAGTNPVRFGVRLMLLLILSISLGSFSNSFAQEESQSGAPQSSPAESTQLTGEQHDDSLHKDALKDVKPSRLHQHFPDLFPAPTIEGEESESIGPGHALLMRTPFAPMIRGTLQERDLRKRPLLFWRRWAERRLPPGAALGFILFVNSLAYALIRSRMEVAAGAIRAHFWRCLGRGLLAVALTVVCVRICFETTILAPLAIVLVGFLELGLIAGLAVVSFMVSTSILSKTGIERGLNLTEHPVLQAVLTVAIASLFAGLILLIPGFGLMPRIGIRLIMLMCLLGFGGLIRTKLGKGDVASI